MSGTVVLILRILLAASLYGFLAWALVLIWRELQTQSQLLAAPIIPPISLTRLDEPAEPEEPGSPDGQHAFEAAEIMIGRSAHCDVSITDDTVSARHARLSFHHNQWWVEDLRSTNGTFLNDERVSMPTVIVSGDELRCGQVSLVVGIEEKSH